MRLRIFIAFLAVSSAAHGESAGESSYQAAIAQCMLTADVAMAIPDDADPGYAAQARKHLTVLETSIPAVARRYPEMGPDLHQSLKEQISSLKDHLLLSGYDTTAHLSFVMAQRSSISHLVDAVRREGVSTQNRMALEICDVVGNYLLIATSPLGPDQVSAFNSDESDFEKRVSSIDDTFDSLSKSSPAVENLRKKWRFIRPALLNRNRISTPFIVCRSGMAVVNGLLEIKEGDRE